MEWEPLAKPDPCVVAFLQMLSTDNFYRFGSYNSILFHRLSQSDQDLLISCGIRRLHFFERNVGFFAMCLKCCPDVDRHDAIKILKFRKYKREVKCPVCRNKISLWEEMLQPRLSCNTEGVIAVPVQYKDSYTYMTHCSNRVGVKFYLSPTDVRTELFHNHQGDE